ncbi:MAG: glycosyltransferase family 2 protein [bacterium]|nr:glycosyltransferase family 2 protein [bacterium]
MDLSFSVVIPSYNGKEFLREDLLALRHSQVKPRKIIIVDDFSSDGTFKMLQNEFPEVLVIRNEKNLGPTASRNRGAKLAEGKYILFLDNDVLVKPDAIEKLLKFLESNSAVAITGGLLVTEQGTLMRWNFGPRRTRFFDEPIGFLFGLINLDEFSLRFSFNYWEKNRSLEVGWTVEGFFLVRRELFEKVGGFDEGFFMFFEGPDLSERFRKIGYKTYFCHKAIATILDSHTHSPSRRRTMFVQGRNLYYQKYFGKTNTQPWLAILGRILSDKNFR